ncbi:hypothetical protein [Roseimaritima ulvae]|uniref:Uncharacterized protein n=1 Tax=Roseimaritima ulvae TaxID=980254 RepID=A0A5B9QZT7_9BACT|nr:hypothetical protein [Roseimaritima ulvae]QEG39523.1 hypothetical protein UC8_15180 [Roseimaritima ulvae]
MYGAEARLLAAAIGSVLDELSGQLDADPDHLDTSPWQFGIAVFDDLESHQRLAVLHRVATYLLTETADTLPLNAINEGAIGVLFTEVRDQVLAEIETPSGEQPDTTWRALAWEAFQESQPQGDATEEIAAGIAPLDRFDDDVERWETLVEWLADNILWDRDYEIADCFLDVAPDKAQHRKLMLGIDDEYFTAIAPDPLPAEVPRLLSETQRLARRYPR